MSWSMVKENALRTLVRRGFGYAASLDLLSDLPDDEVGHEVDALIREQRGAAPSGFAHGGTVSDETAQNLDVHVVPVIAPPWYLDAARKEAEGQSDD